MNSQIMPISDIVIREDLYPRQSMSPSLIQQYAETFDVLPPIEVNQQRILIDGRHRLIAAQKLEYESVTVTMTETATERDLYLLAAQRNAQHGHQLAIEDKRRLARRILNETGLKEAAATKAMLAVTLSVPERTIREWTSRIEKDMKAERSQRIFDMWLACYTQEEIAEAVGLDQAGVAREIEELCKMAELPKHIKLAAEHADGFEVPIYDVWKFKQKSDGANGIQHYGNSESAILDRLLYLYTDPFDIVFDPFAGSGSTIDICKKRSRRYYASDLTPIIERTDIRQYDITSGLPRLPWSEVSLAYLDPPYWRQAAGQYSTKSNDLANMELADFYIAMGNLLRDIAKRLDSGSTVVVLMQPTQWHAPERQVVDHTIDIIQNAPRTLRYVRRISCPYESQQATAQMVIWAKENRDILVLSRELIIWRKI